MSPQKHLLFNSFSVDPKAIKLVIVGQDPYPSKLHATGYAFEVPDGMERPSLNIMKTMASRFGFELHSFEPIKEDVMLLNASLTCKVGKAGSHKEHWAWFTKEVISFIREINPDCKFAFLGKYAQEFNTVEGMEFYHPAANKYAGFDLFNESFYKLTDGIINWRIRYSAGEESPISREEEGMVSSVRQ